MATVKREKLGACGCGEPWVIVCEVRSGLWIAACQSCPCHVYGESADDVRKKWSEEAEKRGNTGKGN